MWFCVFTVWCSRNKEGTGAGTNILVRLLTCCVTLASYFPSLGPSFIIGKVRVGLVPSEDFETRQGFRQWGH